MATRARDTEDELGSLDDILGFHLRLAHGAVYRHFTESFSHLGLTQKQVSVLSLIEEFPGIAQAELAQRLQIDRATTMGIVNRLQARSLIRRGASASDRRKQTLTLEPAGATILAEARAAIGEHERWLKKRFSAAEVATLMDLLKRIYA